ncbi:MAG: UDP-N-acetylmuramoyl-tripeptide--D-alanyl-D-alanine ligase [Sulfobacillus benefaciens]|uniref:UDP-N-acetylmuramoyl-tripeptide--D-alanyl-D-alanine ligase n=1 Tax=Sulfobacillus benefaciens TaxID=453960 RepID=A0A2T2XFL8_9FIRM|nr:MAG: UDP-N-acetylmuramoyl-tripeptide--D-alanyl-D-alanine ligase [Sulfobacillus benefaciens]
MMTMTFGEIIGWTGASPEHVDPAQIVANVTIDSRQTVPNSLFIALPGTRHHGHDFVENAWQAGATAMVESTFGLSGGPLLRTDNPLQAMDDMMRQMILARHIHVVGITGSVGKTSLKELTTAVLRTRYDTGQSHGNYNTAIGLPLSFFGESDLMTHFVAEMGMRQRGEIQYLTKIAPPEVAAISNIGPSHLEQLGSMEEIQAAKGEILEGLIEGGTAVLNYDDVRVRELGKRTDHRVLWYGHHADCDLRIIASQIENGHTRIELENHQGRWRVVLPWIGIHHGANVAAALLIGEALGISLADGIRGVENVDEERSRIHPIAIGKMTVLEDVYNASPVSMKAGIDVLKSFSGRKVAVLGDMLELGAAETQGHFEVGQYAADHADLVVAIGSRSQKIAEGAGSLGKHCDTLEDAFHLLQHILRPNDVVFLKASRGMHFEELVRWLKDWGGPQ